MDPQNLTTTVTEFVLLGLTQIHQLKYFLFIFFLIVYIATWLENFIIIIITVIADHRLHTPMYFLLANLAFMDVSESSVSAPNLLSGLLSKRKTVPFNQCILQMFFFHLIGSAIVFFLVVMAIDRYVAMCKPLRYLTILNRGVCMGLVALSWLGGLAHSAVQIGLLIQLPFCGPNILDNFYCDVPQVIKLLACSDTYLSEVGVIVFSVCLVFSCLVFIIVSYVQIFRSVLRIRSEQGRQKAFSTCLPHLIVVSLFLCTATFAYLKPTSSSTAGLNLMVGVLYSVLPPIMNPIIYSMRNKEIKGAVSKWIGWRLPTKSKMSIFLLQ
uniref:G-protein coupled receptors family 1 profile domain-containing protein n=1 Tax=Gopherus evgoodei TaxID=1825980 RepID=A0A8C4WEM4_9SAUR